MECGYQHDLREVKFNDGVNPYGGGLEFGEKGFSEAAWRTQHAVKRNADLYPTHGVGPMAQMVDSNRGNRLVSLSAVATRSRGLQKHIVDAGGENHHNARVRFALGDIVTTVIQTANGEVIVDRHDTNSPRPYSLGFRVQGTNGLWMKDGDHMYIEGRSPAHQWESSKEYLQEYDHPLWKRWESSAVGAGHGGMDFFVDHAFIESIKNKTETPLDVYDAATISVIVPLSEKSISEGGALQSFPDFTSGRWIKRKPVFALDDTY